MVARSQLLEMNVFSKIYDCYNFKQNFFKRLFGSVGCVQQLNGAETMLFVLIAKKIQTFLTGAPHLGYEGELQLSLFDLQNTLLRELDFTHSESGMV